MKFIGISIILFAFLANPFVIEYLFSPDKKLDFLWKYALIIFFEALILITGLLIYFKPDWMLSNTKKTLLYLFFSLNRGVISTLKTIKIYTKKNKINILLSLLIVIVIFFVMEYTVRFCLFTTLCNIQAIENPFLYTQFDTEDYFLIEHRNEDRWRVRSNSSYYDIDPILGWSWKENISIGCYKTEENGAQDYNSQFDDTSIKILFFGDSFTESISCSNNTIPAKLERNIGIDTLNLGVGGYGFDQIFLKFNNTYKKFNDSIILIGLLYSNLDRSILKFRWNQKPYFEISEDSNLILKGVPVSDDPNEIFDKSKPKIKSYLFNLFYYSDFGRNFFEEFRLKQETKRIDDIKNINEKIFYEMINIKNQDNLTVYFVLYYYEPDLSFVDWRHTFVKKLLDDSDITYFDTKEYLLEYSIENNHPISDFYLMDDGHYNDLGNTIIAQGIANELKKLI